MRFSFRSGEGETAAAANGSGSRANGAVAAALAVLAAVPVLVLLYPTFYRFDSAEFAIGARTLGFVHAPGYPAYLLAAHAFTWLPVGNLPVGDFGLRVNLFSAVCAIAFAPVFWLAMVGLLGPAGRARTARTIAAAIALAVAWSPHVLAHGTIAEVYLPQMLTLALTGCALARLGAQPGSLGRALMAGAAFGLAVAVHPSSALVGLGVAAAFVAARVSMRACVLGGAVAVGVFAVSLLYFPVRAAAEPAFTLAGSYTAEGVFAPLDLRTPAGVWAMLRGEQFAPLFFSRGPLPTAETWSETAAAFVGGLGTGTAALGLGAVLAWAARASFARWPVRWAGAWAAAFVPYTLFYAQYGAVDRAAMFGPSLMLWALAACVLLVSLAGYLRPKAVPVLGVTLMLLPLFTLAGAVPPVVERNRVDIRQRAEAVIAAVPPGALVFGLWEDVVPLQYLHLLEGARPDLEFRNLLLFDRPGALAAHVARVLAERPARPLLFVDDRIPTGLDAAAFRITPFRVDVGDGAGETRVGFLFLPLR
jgi:hypothetical protein